MQFDLRVWTFSLKMYQLHMYQLHMYQLHMLRRVPISKLLELLFAKQFRQAYDNVQYEKIENAQILTWKFKIFSTH